MKNARRMKKFLTVLITLFFAASSFATTWTVSTSGFTFSPDSITITQGDTVKFVLGASHNAQEVAANTWSGNSTTPITGFQTGFGTTEIVAGLTQGLHYYVCGNHAGSGMKGRIFVQAASTVSLSIYPAVQSQFENIGQVNIPVILSGANTDTTRVTVHLLPGGNSATQGSDFIFTDTTLTWLPDSSGGVIVPVVVIDDNTYEHDEFARFQLINATNGAVFVNDTFRMIIRNNDSLANCSDLFISGYVMGPDKDRAVEVFNPTGQVADLSQYQIFISRDGGISQSAYNMGGNLNPNDVVVVVSDSSGAAMMAYADATSAVFDFDGNDAIALIHTGDTIDVMGIIGDNPSPSWPMYPAGSMYYNSLVRNPYVYHGTTNWNISDKTWINGPPSRYDSLGFHRMAPCGSVPPQATVRFMSSGVTVPEDYTDTVWVKVETINPTPDPVGFTVYHNNAASSAGVGIDYTFPFFLPVFSHPTGTYYDSIPLLVKEDQMLEATETGVMFFINLSGNIRVVADTAFNLIITDNDVLTVSFNGAGYSYVEDADSVKVKVTLSGSVPDTNQVAISLAPGNATRNVDFRFTDTIITFYANNIDTPYFWVYIIDDTSIEQNEQVNFNLTYLSGDRKSVV